MNEFYTVEFDRREKAMQLVGKILVTVLVCVVLTVASGIF